MAAFNFPSSPSNGATYSANGVTFTYSSSAGAWQRSSAVGAQGCLLYTSPSPRDLSTSRMPSSA